MLRRLVLCTALIIVGALPGLAQSGEWKQLFDGKKLTGWEHVGPGKFAVDKGLLKPKGGMGLLWYTPEKSGNAVIRVVYMAEKDNSNSGVFIRIPEKPADEWDAINKGYEVQIDNSGDDYHVTGVLYSLTKALARPQKPPGEWNTLEITLDGPRTIVTLNGAMITDYTEGQPVPPKKRPYEPDRGPRPIEGYIGLQNHSDKDVVYFKEVAVKRLAK